MAHILVVDDEAPIRAMVSRYLAGLGHEVRTAATGKEALAKVAAGRFDLVITDINMPDGDGIEILTALAVQDAPPRVLAMSGGGLFDKRLLLASAATLGAVMTLQKPFDLEDMRQAVETSLERGA